MIKRSRRRSPPPNLERALDVHLGMARARQWQRRLWRGSACACAVSLLLWLVGVGLAVHLAALVVAFGIGLALPVRSSFEWALAWVSGHGLSYPTALELTQGETTPGNDPYGFHAAVAQRAGAQAVRLEPPQPQPWWLPLLVTALLLAVLPVNPFGQRQGVTVAGSTRQNTTNPAASAAATVNPESPTPEDPQNPASSQAVDAPQNTAATPTLDDLSAAGGAAAGAEGGSASDAAALNRFLDNLRDRPPPSEPQTNPFSSAAPSQRPGTPGERSQQGGAQDAPRSSNAGQSSQQGEGQNSQSSAGQDGSSESRQQSSSEQGRTGPGGAKPGGAKPK